MTGDFSQYAAVTFTPKSNANLLTVENPLGVVPKLVRVKTTDRTTDTSMVYEFAGASAIGVDYHVYSGNDTVQTYIPTDSEPSSVRTYRFTASAVEVYKPGAVPTFKAGVTYTVHIYA